MKLLIKMLKLIPAFRVSYSETQMRRLLSYCQASYDDLRRADNLRKRKIASWIGDDPDRGLVIQTLGVNYRRTRSFTEFVEDVKRLYNLSNKDIEKILNEFPNTFIEPVWIISKRASK